MNYKSRTARNGTILYFDPSDKRNVEITFEESDFEWDQLTWHFQLTNGISRSLELTHGFNGSGVKVLKAMYTFLDNLESILSYEYISTIVKRDLTRCKKDVTLLIDMLKKAY